MNDTMKAAWLAGLFALLSAIIAGLFALFGTPNNTTYSSSSPVITGDDNQVTITNPDQPIVENKK